MSAMGDLAIDVDNVKDLTLESMIAYEEVHDGEEYSDFEGLAKSIALEQRPRMTDERASIVARYVA